MDKGININTPGLSESQREQIRKLEASREEQRKQAFEWVKGAYKGRTNAFQRLKLKLDGKAPNWNKIARYSKEELQFLQHTLQGETNQKIAYERMIDANHGISNPKKAQEWIKEDRWDDFVKQLSSKEKLDNAMEYDKMYDNPNFGRRR